MPVLKVAAVEAEIRKRRGNLAAVGRAFGVTRQSVFTFVGKHPALRLAVHDCRQSAVDTAESKLQKAVRAGEPWAVQFFLKTQGKGRGYVERQEFRRVTDDDIDRAIELELARVGAGRQGTVPGSLPPAPDAGGGQGGPDLDPLRNGH